MSKNKTPREVAAVCGELLKLAEMTVTSKNAGIKALTVVIVARASIIAKAGSKAIESADPKSVEWLKTQYKNGIAILGKKRA